MAQITLGFPNLELLWRFLIDCHVANVSTDAQGLQRVYFQRPGRRSFS
jgi:hypothetical protein